MLKKVLVANRGEIAIRVMRACRELGIRTVAVYSEADKDALHVQMADEAVEIGPAPARQSYLSIPAIVQAASQVHADGLHPGYGFLAENPALAEVLALWGITFIGPPPAAIRAMGLKTTAKETMRQAGVPLAPGSDGVVSDLAEASRVAERVGYPVMVKAVAGGGGRGIRVARQEAELADALERAASEAKASFGDGAVFLEMVKPSTSLSGGSSASTASALSSPGNGSWTRMPSRRSFSARRATKRRSAPSSIVAGRRCVSE